MKAYQAEGNSVKAVSKEGCSNFGKGVALKRGRKMVAIDEAVHKGRVWLTPVGHVEKLGLYLKSTLLKDYSGCLMERRLQ